MWCCNWCVVVKCLLPILNHYNLNFFIFYYDMWVCDIGDSVGNTTVFSVIWMCYLLSARSCMQQNSVQRGLNREDAMDCSRWMDRACSWTVSTALMIVMYYYARTFTVWEPSVLVAVSVVCRLSVCFLSVCLSRIRSRKLSVVGAKFCYLCRKSGSPSKNTMLDFAPKVAK